MALNVYQFTKNDLPHGFKLTGPFLENPVCQKSIEVIRNRFPGKKIIIVTQTNISNRMFSTYNPVFLNKELLEQLDLNNVITKLLNNSSIEVPQVDGIWKFNDSAEGNVIILTFSQTAPIIVAECEEGIFVSTILRQNITKDTFKRILDLLPPWYSEVTFRVISSTDHKYDNGTLSEQIKKIVEDLNCKFDSFGVDVNSDVTLFGYSEKVPDFPELGLANNLVATW